MNANLLPFMHSESQKIQDFLERYTSIQNFWTPHTLEFRRQRETLSFDAA
jgi:hypothetical protein